MPFLTPVAVSPDGAVPFTGNQSMGGNLLRSLGSPLVSTDAAAKGYVDASIIGAPVFNVKTGYGAAGNGVEGNTAALTSGSAALTVTGGAFSVGDVGKAIQVVAAGAAGAVLNTTISAYTSATQVTLAVSAGTTVANAYYAYGTDDTTAIQNSLDAAAASGGTVYFPSGCYIVAGSLQSLSATIGGHTYNQSVQLQIPAVDYFAGPMATVKLQGPFIACPSPSVTGAAPLQTDGAIIRGFAASGNLIGGLPPGTSTYNFNGLTISIENLTFRLYDNPQASAINLSYISSVQLNNVNADTGVTYTDGETPPTSSSAYGIMLPRDGNGAYTQIINVLAQGYYYGYEINEHTNALAMSAWGCKYAASICNADHSIHIKRFEDVHNANGFIFSGANQFISSGVTSVAPIIIDEHDIEVTTSGTFARVVDVVDPGSYASGTIGWWKVVAGVGYGNTYTVTGGGKLYRYQVNVQPIAAGPLGLSVLSGNQYNVLTWTAVPGASGYYAYGGSDPGNLHLLSNGAINATTYADIDLTNGQTYYYTVQSTVGSFQSALSNVVSGAPSAGTAEVLSQNWDTNTTGVTLYGSLSRTAEGFAHSGADVLADATAGDPGMAISTSTDGNNGNQITSSWIYFNDNAANVETWVLGRTTNAAVGSLVGYCVDLQTNTTTADGLALRYRNAGANTELGLAATGEANRPGHAWFATSANYYQKWFKISLGVWENTVSGRIYDPSQGKWLNSSSVWVAYPVDFDTVVDTNIASGTAQHGGVMGFGVNATAFGLDDFNFGSATAASVPQFSAVGSTTNDSAPEGDVGEFISSGVAIGSAVSLTTATAANVTSILLTPGDWDVEGSVGFTPAGSTVPTVLTASISNGVSAALPTAPNGGAYSKQAETFPTGVDQVLPTGKMRISLASTTTIYLIAQASFTVSTLTAYGFISARRAR